MSDKLLDLGLKGYTARSIAHHLGMNETYVRNYLRGKGIMGTHLVHDLKHGFSQDTFKLRSELGALVTLILERGTPYREVSELTGLNQREINSAKDYPYDHDWTISQIERTLEATGKVLNDII